MLLQPKAAQRTGSILPMVVVCLVALLGFVALAVDIGMIMVARTQCQAVADCAAMAGARTLTGDVSNNNNYSAVTPNINTVTTASSVLSKPVQLTWVTSEIGYYTYNRTTNKFGKILPSGGGQMPTGENWSLVQVRVDYGQPTYFAKVLGINTFQTGAVATAVHRPRDVVIIIDLSGSMSFDSLLGASYNGARSQSSNPETVVPVFGHYAGYNPVATTPYILGSGEVLGLSNLTFATNAGPAMVNDYYQNNFGAAPIAAFTAQPASYATVPGGDIPLKKNLNTAAQPYATNVKDVMNNVSTYNASWETLGYTWASLNSGTSKPFTGYTMGPSYWGKSFFVWPPHPLNDWRKKFFLKGDKITAVDDNSIMWTTGSGATVKVPIATGSAMTSYYINYAAILRWLKTTGTNPFPAQLRAGRISYYTAIPDVSIPANDAALNNRMYVANPVSLNERFWKHYIDFVLGFQQSGTTYTDISGNVGYGPVFTWGTKMIHTKPVAGTTPTPNDIPGNEPIPARYMNYNDNPPRPKTGYWFGPMTLLDFLDNYNQGRRWMPGTAHQAPSWGCKIGMRTAIIDIRNNHPNDYVSLSFFNTPEYSAGDGGKFNRIRTPLGHNYQEMVDKLFYPPITVDNPVSYPEINCYDATNMRETPHADGSTCPAMSFMQAFNQFSTSSTLASYNPSGPSGDAGGLGRKGAQKVIIFETDGVANTPANAAFVNGGAYTSYYKIRVGTTTEYPSNSNGSFSSLENQLYDIAQKVCNLDTASTPGYSTPRKPALIHSVAYGSLFDPSVSAGASAARNAALAILQEVQYIGKTQSSPSTALPSYKIITGTSQQRIDLMQQCFFKIMDDTVSVTLIE